jgi:hypothetical protein
MKSTNRAKKETPLQKARRQLSTAAKNYKTGKATLNEVQKAASNLAVVSCKVKK